MFCSHHLCAKRQKPLHKSVAKEVEIEGTYRHVLLRICREYCLAYSTEMITRKYQHQDNLVIMRLQCANIIEHYVHIYIYIYIVNKIINYNTK